MNTTDRDRLREMLIAAQVPYAEAVNNGKPEILVSTSSGRPVAFWFHPDNSLARIL